MQARTVFFQKVKHLEHKLLNKVEYGTLVFENNYVSVVEVVINT